VVAAAARVAAVAAQVAVAVPAAPAGAGPRPQSLCCCPLSMHSATPGLPLQLSFVWLLPERLASL